jgi:hypothetical protein
MHILRIILRKISPKGSRPHAEHDLNEKENGEDEQKITDVDFHFRVILSSKKEGDRMEEDMRF